MVDRFLAFIKSKLFLGGLGILVLGIAVANYFSYANEKANEIEFQKFQNVNQQLVFESEIENLINETDLSFDKLGFEIITKSVIAKKALDEGKYQVALDLFMEAYVKISESKIRKETKDILLNQYSENIVRLNVEIGDFEAGDRFIKENTINSARFHDVAGDFYKYFENYETSNFHYDQALSFDMDEFQKNNIRLRKPLN